MSRTGVDYGWEYPAGCEGPDDSPEYDGPEIEARYDLDIDRWAAVCPWCGGAWKSRREDCARWDAEECYMGHRWEERDED